MRFALKIISEFYLYEDKMKIIKFITYFMTFYILGYVSYCIGKYSSLIQTSKMWITLSNNLLCLLKTATHKAVFFMYKIFYTIKQFRVVCGTAFIYETISTWPPLSQSLCNALRGPNHRKKKKKKVLQCYFHTKWNYEEVHFTL